MHGDRANDLLMESTPLAVQSKQVGVTTSFLPGIQKHPQRLTNNNKTPNPVTYINNVNNEACHRIDSIGGASVGPAFAPRIPVQPVVEMQQVAASLTNVSGNRPEANSNVAGPNGGSQILCKVCGDKAR